MSVKHRVDSVQELKHKKTNEQLSQENKEMKIENQSLKIQVTDLQLALCDVYELVETAVLPTE